MNHKFDELAKSLAQSVTRRRALKKFGVGFAGVVLASLGLANKARASKPGPGNCHNDNDCAHLGPGAYCGWCFGNLSYRFRCCKLPQP